MPSLPLAPHEDEQPDAEPQEAQRDLAFRMLYNEQTRLRSAVEQIQARQAQDKQGEGKPDGAKPDPHNGSEDQDKDEEKDKDKDKKPPQKPPLKERTAHWIHGHPILSILLVVGMFGLVIASVLILHYVDSYENTDDAFVDGHTDPISARVNGIVSGVYVEDTSIVKKASF